MGWYFTILEEMRTVLGLKGNELIVYAFINGYSQRGQGCFYGSLAFLQEVCGISKQTAVSTLRSLVEQGLINKSENYRNGVKFVSYSISQESIQGVKNLDRGGQEIRHNNIIDNNNSRDKSLDIYNKAQAFQKPSLEEVKAFCQERGNSVDPEAFIAHYESNGWMVGRNKMKNWRQAVITWEKSTRRTTPSQTLPQKESVLEHNLKVADRLMGTNLHAQYYGKKEGGIDEQ